MFRDQQASAQYVALLGLVLFPRPRLKSHRCYLSRPGTLRHSVEHPTLKSARSELCKVFGQNIFPSESKCSKKDNRPKWRKAVYSRSSSESCCYICLKLFKDGRWVSFMSQPGTEMSGVFKTKQKKFGKFMLRISVRKGHKSHSFTGPSLSLWIHQREHMNYPWHSQTESLGLSIVYLTTRVV